MVLTLIKCAARWFRHRCIHTFFGMPSLRRAVSSVQRQTSAEYARLQLRLTPSWSSDVASTAALVYVGNNGLNAFKTRFSVFN